MTDDAKRKTLACLLAAMILMALIAAALPQLELKPGVPLPRPADASWGVLPEENLPAVTISISAFWKAVLSVLVIAGLIYNGYKLLRGARWNWKDFLRSFAFLAVPIIILTGLLVLLSGARFTLKPLEMEVPPPAMELTGPPLEAVPPGLLWLVWLGLAATLIGLGLWFVFRKPARPDRLKLEAERALQALKTGLDLRNVILHCYWQMTQVLKQEQGLEMEAAMTTREFERLLEARGVPAAPVQQLTRLFEAARYGQRAPGPGDEGRAVDCLTAIVRYSQMQKRAH
jgi:hypothetical protein